MKRFIALAVLAAAIFAGPALAQTFNMEGQPAPGGGTYTLVQPSPGPAIGVTAPGSPTYVMPANKEGSVIDVGQAFGFLAPYVNSLVGLFITSGMSWLGYLLHKKFGLNIDASNRDALQTALLNAASSLIADGAVKLSGATVSVGNAELAAAVNQVLHAAPDAAKYWNISPDTIQAKIIDKIPQVPAGAQMIANAANGNGNGTAALAPAPIPAAAAAAPAAAAKVPAQAPAPGQAPVT